MKHHHACSVRQLILLLVVKNTHRSSFSVSEVHVHFSGPVAKERASSYSSQIRLVVIAAIFRMV